MMRSDEPQAMILKGIIFKVMIFRTGMRASSPFSRPGCAMVNMRASASTRSIAAPRAFPFDPRRC
jgi:hypothetical protein